MLTIDISEASVNHGGPSDEPLIREARTATETSKPTGYVFDRKVVEVESIDAIFDALETTGSIVLRRTEDLETDYRVTIYNGYLE